MELKEAKEKFKAGKRNLTASQRNGLIDAIKLHRTITGGAKLPHINIDNLPGMSKMQLDSYINQLAKMQVDLKKSEKEIETAVKAIKQQKSNIAEAKDRLTEAAKQLHKKAVFCRETSDNLIEIKVFFKDQVPGVQQILNNPDDVKVGEKAGDLFGRITAELGETIGLEVQKIFAQCKTDLTHTTTVASVSKLVAKTASIHPQIQKNAGVFETVKALKEWFTGGVNSITRKTLGFAENIKSWLKGFITRTKIVEKSANNIDKAIKKAEKGIEKITA